MLFCENLIKLNQKYDEKWGIYEKNRQKHREKQISIICRKKQISIIAETLYLLFYSNTVENSLVYLENIYLCILK